MKEDIPSVKMTKLAEEGAADMVSCNVNLDDGYMKLIDAESTPYYSYDEIIGILKNKFINQGSRGLRSGLLRQVQAWI